MLKKFPTWTRDHYVDPQLCTQVLCPVKLLTSAAQEKSEQCRHSRCLMFRSYKHSPPEEYLVPYWIKRQDRVIEIRSKKVARSLALWRHLTQDFIGQGYLVEALSNSSNRSRKLKKGEKNKPCKDAIKYPAYGSAFFPSHRTVFGSKSQKPSRWSYPRKSLHSFH